ncbi:MAG TPA: sulfotransferase [Dinghuibacter sp.]|jgi:hypothetical protein|uniref:sulfotransferase n=1 Tax=Dinghuibacter sp. TaxID=2024697 RepID=UPI002BD4498E|nr:sulfotransferase [Dinghuibacter sp.]HTJ10965.1 sulfotransferase [Dinghuibacter sp.]
MKLVDVTGFGHSGKSSVVDFLKQYDAVFGFPNQVEFELFRVPGGLLDLYFAIYVSWNPIRATTRINEFRKLVKRIGTIQTGSRPLTYFTASGHGYEQYFNGRFIELSHRLIDKMTEQQIYTFWPYELLRMPYLTLFYKKLKSKFFNSLVSSTVYFSDRDQFIRDVRSYVEALFAEVETNGATHFLLSNAFDAYNPGPCLEMAGDACSIIVDRDPRDIYASLIAPSEGFIPAVDQKKNMERIKKDMTGFNDIHQFIARNKIIRGNVNDPGSDRILRLRYEDFILDHERQAERVKSFIGLPAGATITRAGFDASKSSKNIGLWKKYRDTPEIKLIESELRQYCYQI